MIWIISGSRNSGKTGRLLALYGLTRIGDGLVMPKALAASGEFSGYDILRLAGGESRPMARLKRFLPPGWDEGCRCGHFSFSAAAFAFAAAAVDAIIERGSNPVYLDEIGPLELARGGFHPLLMKILRAERDLYLTVRAALLREVQSEFGLASAAVIRLQRRKS